MSNLKPGLIKSAQQLVHEGDAFLEVHGPLNFYQAAQELLQEACLHDKYNFKELVESSMMSQFTHPQNYSSFQFSDLPITLAWGKHCFLDLYFWRRRPTVIHDHHFTGAFQCLEGVNVDLEFEFFKEKSLGQHHEWGSLKLKNTRHLKRGGIAAIDLLDKFIHQNHHQDELTVNICFRTPDIGVQNLSNYLYSGLRYEKHPALINRVERLKSFAGLGEFDVSRLDISLDDALYFLLSCYKSESRNPRFKKMIEFMDKRVKEETGMDIHHLMDLHEITMDNLENAYN